MNAVTATLFQKYRTAEDYARAGRASLEREIRSTGFFRSKAGNIVGACRILVERYGGRVPSTMEALVALPGVGRKTANVVLGTGFGRADGIVVDTHVRRIARRLGLTRETDPAKVERDLIGLIPRKDWISFSHMLIWHGRRLCTARKPNCAACPLARQCPSSRGSDPDGNGVRST